MVKRNGKDDEADVLAVPAYCLLLLLITARKLSSSKGFKKVVKRSEGFLEVSLLDLQWAGVGGNCPNKLLSKYILIS